MTEQTTMTEREKVGRILADMMTENTGRHFLDSGGAHGRQWERAQAAVAASGVSAFELFEHSPTASLEVWRGGPMVQNGWRWTTGEGDWQVTQSTYHFLANVLRVPDESDAVAELWETTRDEDPDESYYNAAARFVEEVLPEAGFGLSGIYGEGEPYSDNTYNRENNLSQDFQFWYFTARDLESDRDLTYGDGTVYVLLQIHGGADIRGGYTMPRLFVVDADDETDFLNWDEWSAWCDRCDTYWSYRSEDLEIWWDGHGHGGGCAWRPDPDQEQLELNDKRAAIEHIIVAVGPNDKNEAGEPVDDPEAPRLKCSHCGGTLKVSS